MNPDYIVIKREDAIKNMGGLVWLYEKHLSNFKNTYGNSADITREYLMNGQTGEAQIFIHSIKGLAGTLGMRHLYYAAAALEQAIKNTDPAVNNCLKTYETCLLEVLAFPIKD